MAAAALVSLALLCASLVHAQDPRCTTNYIGDSSGMPFPLPDIYLQPPTRTWDIRIPPNVCPPLAQQVGIKMVVCDPDAPPAPTIQFGSYQDVIVQRNAYRITQSAKLSTTVLCMYAGGDRTQNVANVVKAVPADRQ